MRASVATILSLVVAAGCGRLNFDGPGRADVDADGDTDGATGDADAVNLVEVIEPLTPSPPVNGFGDAVAMSGDGTRIVAGTHLANADRGAVYVFVLTPTGWMQEARLVPAIVDTDRVGESVAINHDGSVLVAGGPWEDGDGSGPENQSAPDAGAAWVWRRTGSTWTEGEYLKAADPDDDDNFGEAVAISADGTRIIVGAPGDDSASTGIGGDPFDNSADNTGAAFVFADSGSGFALQTFVKATNPDTGDELGRAVAISGDGSVIAVGALGEDSNATGVGGDQTNDVAIDAGAVYVYPLSPPGGETVYLKASNTDFGDAFGSALSLSTDGARLLVGANGEDGAGRGVNPVEDEGANGAGAAYLFENGPGGWAQVAYVKATNAQLNDVFSLSVAVSGDGSAAIVGAPAEDGSQGGRDPVDDDLQPNSGAAYTFARAPSGPWSSTGYLKAPSPKMGGVFGFSCALSADGSVLAVGAPTNDSSGGDVYVFRMVPE